MNLSDSLVSRKPRIRLNALCWERLGVGRESLKTDPYIELVAESESAEFELDFDQEVLKLRALDENWTPLALDYSSPEWKRRLSSTNLKDPLLKAVGLGRKKSIRVLDLCAGLGEDAMLMEHFGAVVTSLERSAPLFLLLSDALLRFAPELPKPTLYFREARDYLAGENLSEFDLCYLDPMFPDLGSHALPSRPMQYLRKLLPSIEGDAEGLIKAALKSRIPNVLLKRPLKALPLGDVRRSYAGKSHRFDLYDQHRKLVRI